MAEEKNNHQGYALMDSEIAKQLRKIAGDLWGNSGSAVPDVTAAGKPARAAAANPPKPAKKTERPAVNLRNLWKTADETIEWTDALRQDYSPDGLTSPALWQLCHQKAEAVLAGDTGAYAEMLQAANPLAELTRFADRITIKPVSGDRLECGFEAKTEYMADQQEHYLAAVSLRAARDLFACLPVTEVFVCGKSGNETLLTVTYRREQFLKKNFLFLNPTEFARECGADFEPVR